MNDQTPPGSDKELAMQTISSFIAKQISEDFPLRGKEAADSMRLHLSRMSNQAGEEGLTEEAVMDMLNERD